MWFFHSPRIVFGEDALSWLAQMKGRRAFVVTDEIMAKLGYLAKIEEQIQAAGMACASFTRVEPDPSLPTVQECADQMTAFGPDWIIGLGGGSCLDAAKAAWFLYEKPGIDLEGVSALEEYGLRSKARFITIPTTAGSGAEVTAAAVITDPAMQRKLEISSYELVADLAIVDPMFSSQMPQSLTADTGIDVLTHSVEGYSSSWSNDFSDGLCLQATRMVFDYLPRAVRLGASDPEARQKMANAATIGALGMGSSHIALAHALGHAAGARLHLPHGRVTGLFLPYTIEYTANSGSGRYLGLANILGLAVRREEDAGMRLASAIRDLLRELNQPTSLKEAGVSAEAFQTHLEAMNERAMIDVAMVTSRRMPGPDEMTKLFEYGYEGKSIDF